MNDFFKEFRSVTEKEWKQKVQVELKGKDYTEVLCKNSPEGFQIKPLYTHNDVKKRTTVNNKSDWNIISYFIEDHKIPYDLLDGVILTENNVSLFLPTEKELIFLKASNQNKEQQAPNKNSYLLNDFIGEMCFAGKKLNEKFLKALKISKNNEFKNTISINLSSYQNSGASITQQLAIMLSIGQAYVELYSSQDALKKPIISFALGSDLFGEIAKLRAARILWANFSSAYKIDSELEILAESSLRNKSAMDKYNNIIRSSFEGISAVIGGADHVLLNPYDEVFKTKKDISQELSIKQQLLMKKEAMFNQFTDPGSGNYFIESLTHQFAQKAWQLFKEWEKQGGFIKCVEKNIIQDAVIKHAKEEQESFDNKEKTMIGVNIYPSENDKVNVNDIERQQKNHQKVDFKTLVPQRLAEVVESNF